MYKYDVQITEKEKFIENLSFGNIEEEVVGFMYKQVICKPVRTDLVFFIILFFIGIKDPISGNSALYKLFDDNITKLNSLNEIFRDRKRKLKKGEYAEIIESMELNKVLSYDLLFLLTEGIIHSEILEIKYREFFLENPDTLNELKRINSKFGLQVSSFYFEFSEYSIEDERYDADSGEIYDLSKSVHRTIKMRLNRRLFAPLQNNTKIHTIRSESPILVDFIQNIDSDIIITLWDKYHVAEYLGSLYGWTKESISVKTEVNLWDLIAGYYIWKITEGRSAKDEERKNFETKKNKYLKENNILLKELNKTILGSSENMEREISSLRQKNDNLQERINTLSTRDKKLKKRLEKDIRNLENLVISIKESDNQ